MSTESIVNRVSSNFAEDELKKLEPEKEQPNLEAQLTEPTVSEQPVTYIVTGKTISREEFNKIAKSAPLIDQVLDNPAIVEVLHDQGFEANQDILNNLRALVGGEDFKVFRSQVIRAFKHSGIDTRKFFGE